MIKSVSKEVKAKSIVTKEEWKEFTKTVWSIANVSHEGHPAVFPAEIPRRLIKLFSFYGETVLDPFGGTGTTAATALEQGRNAISVDQSSHYTKLAQARCRPLVNGVGAHVLRADARKMDFVDDASVGLIVTSPPYWDKADYGSEKWPRNSGLALR